MSLLGHMMEDEAGEMEIYLHKTTEAALSCLLSGYKRHTSNSHFLCVIVTVGLL